MIAKGIVRKCEIVAVRGARVYEGTLYYGNVRTKKFMAELSAEGRVEAVVGEREAQPSELRAVLRAMLAYETHTSDQIRKALR